MTDRVEPEKRFDEWIMVKKNLHFLEKIPKISEGEVWWCGVGENVGIEINGKSNYFSRPVLVFKKLSRYGFLGVPLTSQPHAGSWYIPFRFQGKDNVAVLAQIRTMSTSRLYSRMGKIDETDLARIRSGFRQLYCE